MTTYNTGNPVPSADARDRYDNSQTLDEVVNGDSESYASRTGKQVISLGGMNSRFNNAQEARESEFNLSQEEKQESFQTFLDGTGWSSIGAYGAGVVITSHTQTVDYQGQPYQLKPSIPASLDAPYVTTGDWATEGANFKLVGDNSLRQELANSTDPIKGAGIVWTKDRAPLSVGISLGEKFKGYRTLRDFGAKGSGFNDTTALLNAAASGENIWVDDAFTFQDAMLELTNGQTWTGTGTLTQKSVAISNIPANPSVAFPASDYPAFRLSGDGSTIKGFKVIAAWEGAQLSGPNTKALGMTLVGQPTNYYDGVIGYADNVEIVGNNISRFGKWMTGASYAKRGEGIFLSNGATFNKTAKVRGNTCLLNAKNGLLVIGYQGVGVEGNFFIANRMSAFQIAFLAGLGVNNAKDILFKGNYGWNNGADCFDANNNTGSGVKYDLDATIDGNNFGRNGWVYDTREDQLLQSTAGLSTADGGAATLINVAGVTYSNNRVTDQNRNCGYLTNVDRIDMHGNVYKKSDHSALDDTDGFRLQNATNCHIHDHKDMAVPRTQYRIEGDCTGTVIERNITRSTDGVASVNAVITPAGTTGFIFDYNTVKIITGNFILNPFWDHKFCKFEASVSGITDYTAAVKDLSDNKWNVGSGRIVITGPTGLRFQRNKVAGNTNDLNGLCCIRNALGGGRISDNDLLNNGATATLLIDGAATAGDFYLMQNNIDNANGGASNNLRVNTTVTLAAIIYTDGNKLTLGTPTYGSSTKKVLTWT